MICYIAKPWEMPFDKAGNRADLVGDPLSTLGRMNLGRMYETYFNGARRDTLKTIKQELGYMGDKKPLDLIKSLLITDNDKVNRMVGYLQSFYDIVSPLCKNIVTPTHLAEVLAKEIYIYHPTDNQIDLVEAVKQLEKNYPQTYGPVTYTGYSGKQVTTKCNVRISSMYFILLEKTGDDYSAVSSGKLQHFGVLSNSGSSDKYMTPVRNSAVRGLGEAEVRIYVSYAGTKVTTELLDRHNNPLTHRYMLGKLLAAEKPTDIDNLVDRKEVPLGGAKPLVLAAHMALCGGWRFAYKPHQPNW